MFSSGGGTINYLIITLLLKTKHKNVQATRTACCWLSLFKPDSSVANKKICSHSSLKSCLLATAASHRHFSDQVQEHYCHVGTCQSRDECSCNRFTSSPTKESTSLSKATMNQYWSQISPSKCCYESIYRCYIKKKEGFLEGLWIDLSYQAAPPYWSLMLRGAVLSGTVLSSVLQ